MKITKIITYCYYLVLASVIGFKMLETIYAGGLLLSYQLKTKTFYQQKQSLIDQKNQLSTQLAQSTALYSLDELAQSSFEPITDLIVINQSDQVAFK